MTVKELIEKLNKYDPETEVLNHHNKPIEDMRLLTYIYNDHNRTNETKLILE